MKDLCPVDPLDGYRFIFSLIKEAVTRGNRRNGVNSNQNTVIFEQNRALASHLIVRINDSPRGICDPHRFLEISEYLQDLPEEEREGEFPMLLQEFQGLSINLQKRYSHQILQYQRFISTDLQTTLQEYQKANTAIIDRTIASTTSLSKEILEFAKKEIHLQNLHELNSIIMKYISIQSYLKKNLSPQLGDREVTFNDCMNSLRFRYQKNIVPIRSRFLDETLLVNHMDEPIRDYLTTKFPRGFFQNLPKYFFPHIEDPNKLDEDCNKYKIETIKKFIVKVFNNDIAAFQTSSKEEIIEKLTNYCINNFNGFKIQFLKIQQQSYRILHIATEIFTFVIAPLFSPSNGICSWISLCTYLCTYIEKNDFSCFN